MPIARLQHVARCLTAATGAPSRADTSGSCSEELYWISIAEATERFASGTLTPVELLEACLARIDATEDRLNSFVKDMRMTAMQQAEASAERWKAGAPLGPLDGIPICVKGDACPIERSS
jgi:Asp-tRNA(Asn)/Glu-tRNA(Gln) amidotransferase A subunit family amidase